MSGDLTTFEKNYKEWNSKHPTRSPDRWVATTDRREVAKFIAEQTDEITKTQLKAANDIIASQESVKREVEEVSQGVDRLATGLEDLRATFQWGFSELIWQMEKQRETLQEILETLQKPLDTKAKELKKRAEKAYTNGWIDDALQDFLESEKKNKYDFTVHHNLGNIYFFHKGNPGKALEYYQKAVKYAEPESSYHASYSLLHIAEIKYLQEKFAKAYEATEKAINLTPEFSEAHYQYARYCAQIGEYNEALEHLKSLICNNKYYATRASSEGDFDVMKKQLKNLFKELRAEARENAEHKIERTEKLVLDAKSHNAKDYAIEKFKLAKENLNESKDLFERNNLFDYLGSSRKAKEARKIAIDSSIESIKNQISETKSERDQIEEELQRKGETLSSLLFFVTTATVAIITTTFIILTVEFDSSPGPALILGMLIGSGLGGAALAQLFTPLFDSLGNVYVKFRFKKYKKHYKKQLRKLRRELSDAQNKSLST